MNKYTPAETHSHRALGAGTLRGVAMLAALFVDWARSDEGAKEHTGTSKVITGPAGKRRVRRL